MRYLLITALMLSLVIASCKSKSKSFDLENDPIKIAKRAYELIMLLEGGDDINPDVAAEVQAITDLANNMSIFDKAIYDAELQQYYTGVKQYFRHIAKFKDTQIPMLVFFTFINDGEGIGLDKIIFEYDDSTQEININDLLEPLSDEFFVSTMPLHFWYYDFDDFFQLETNDYNFDGFMDIAIYNSAYSGASNYLHDIFMYNPEQKSYYHHKQLSALYLVWVEEETKTVKSRMKGGHAGLIYEEKEYKWDSGKLVLIHNEVQDYDPNTEKYIRITRILQADGRWSETSEIFTEEDFREE